MIGNKGKHPLLAQELVKYAVDQEGLRKMMEEVVHAVNEVQGEVRGVQGEVRECSENAKREKQGVVELGRELKRLEASQEAIVANLLSAEALQKLFVLSP